MPGAEDAPERHRTVIDEAFMRILAGVRDGTLRHDVDHTELELGEQFDLRPGVLQGALQRFADIGMARRVPGDDIRFTTLDPVTWAEASWMLVGLVEVAMRAAVPAMTDDDVRQYEQLVTVARASAAARDDGLDPAVFATIAFWADHTPEPLTAGLLRRALLQLRYGAASPAPWTVTAIESWLASSLQASRLRNAGSAERAAHVLGRLWRDHLTSVAERLGIAADALLRPVDAPSEHLYWADWQADDDWFEVLGAIRGGSLERGQEYAFSTLTARFRLPLRRLLPMLRRLEVMGLVEGGTDADGSIVVATPGVEEWAQSLNVLAGMSEMSARSGFPELTATQAEEIQARITRVRRAARTRDYAYSVALFELHREIAVHARNRAMRETTLATISRLAFILPTSHPFEQWEIEDYLQLLEEAVQTRDPEVASEASHALAAHHDAHIAVVRAHYGTMES
jgi:DNA-binding GntR family transcriptional regulator